MSSEVPEIPLVVETETHKANVTHCGHGEYEITIVYQGRDLVKSSRFKGLDALFSAARDLIDNPPPQSISTKFERKENMVAVLRDANGNVKPSSGASA